MTASTRAADEAAIRALIDRRVEAIRAKDVGALLANHAPDVLTFDVVNPLQNAGADAVRRRAEQWFSAFQGPLDYEIRQLSISAGDAVAFCHFLNRVGGTGKDGKKVDMWWRATVCFRKQTGAWLIAHEHDSVPFDMQSGRASIDLKP